MSQRLKNRAGLTLIELIIALAIMGILASVAMPLAEVTVKRTKELELRRNLLTIRKAIDSYREDYNNAVKSQKINADLEKTGYPQTLETLTTATDWHGLYPFPKKYLRRIPHDPFDSYDEGWGMRSYQDKSDSSIWGEEDVYDIYSQSDKTALDGSYYQDW